MMLRVLIVLTAFAIANGCGSDPSGSGADGGADLGDGGAGTDRDATSSGCVPQTCADRNWSCGQFISCGLAVDCADEGSECRSGETCIGGINGPTECVAQGGATCDVCDAIPDCSDEAQPTVLRGRVITPGRDDADVGNQVGVPNAVVAILATSDPETLPPIPAGLPPGETSCSRCEDQAEFLGPFLTGALTDATGHFELEADIPVGTEIVLVTMAGKFRRAEVIELSEEAACTTTDLPVELGGEASNPTRLPRSMDDEGFGIHIPRIVVTTGRVDAMECVLEKIGLDHGEFGNPGSDARVHLYLGQLGEGLRIDGDTPPDTDLYSDLSALESYDIYISDCQGNNFDDDFELRDAHGDNIIDYVNRGGRMFASHLSFTWLHGNGELAFDPENPLATGLADAAEFNESLIASPDSGTGVISFDSPNADPTRITQFALWMDNEGVTSGEPYEFPILEPRPQALELGPHTQEYVHCNSSDCDDSAQQFAFDTPYGAPADDACGRVAFSAFHVASGGSYIDGTFPDDCLGGDLTDQEKVLLFMLFDLAACVGDPLPPECTPRECDQRECGLLVDGCGGIIDCGVCPIE